jgi:ribosomal protein S18 acetylase RimI-like enzyme
MSVTIVYEENPSTNDLKLLSDGICAEAYLKRGLPKGKSFCFLCKDIRGKIVGGVYGWIVYGCLHIDELWVESIYRDQNLGSKLIIKAQEYGKINNCSFSTVNTMDFEAKPFYEKLGYEVEFMRKGYDKNTSFYFLRKELTS